MGSKTSAKEDAVKEVEANEIALANQLDTVHSVPSARSHDKNNMKKMQEIADRFDGFSQDEYNSGSPGRSKLSVEKLNAKRPGEQHSPDQDKQAEHPYPNKKPTG